MPSINDFRGIPPITWSFIVVMVIGTIIPGLLLVFLFRPDLFMSIETIKLLLLSMGITLPVWLCNTILAAIIMDKLTSTEKEDQVGFHLQIMGLLGAIFSVPALFLPAIIEMFVDLSPHVAFYIGFGIEIAIVLFGILLIKNDKKSNAKKALNTK